MSSNNNAKALKSGVWYTAASFITKGIGFFTTPIFARLLSQNDYGMFSNYVSWQSTALSFVTLCLYASFISARFDFKEDFDGYISSSLVLSTLIALLWGLAVNLFPGFFVSLTGLELKYINIMLTYLVMCSAVDMFQSRERYKYEYKVSVVTSLVISISAAVLSVILVTNLDNKLFGRIIGFVTPTILVGFVLYIFLMRWGKKVSIRYWKYALPICLPYVPHILSLSLLNSMDKMMITRICGAEDNALYSIAYSCGALITLLVTSLNTAFSPWLGEKLNGKSYDEIKKVSKAYILLFVYGACGIMLLSPELLMLMGGKRYFQAIYVMPPIAFGCVCQFLYTMFVNVEQFGKKTFGMAVGSVVAALSNYVLNRIFIPRFGYVAAAYTTLASYAILLLIHIWLVRRMGLLKVYPIKTIGLVILFMSLFTLLTDRLYHYTTVRYLAVAAYGLVTVCVFIKYRKELLKIGQGNKLINWLHGKKP